MNQIIEWLLELTPQQFRVLACYIDLFREKEKTTYEEARRRLGYVSASGVQNHVFPLVKKGFLRKEGSAIYPELKAFAVVSYVRRGPKNDD